LTAWSAGDLLSLVGVVIAIWQIHRARSVAEQVGESVREVRKQLERKTLSVDLNELIRELEEMKEMHRSTEAHSLLATRYTAVRVKLIQIKSRYPGWSPKQKASLQESISEFSNFEHLLDSASTQEEVSLKDGRRQD
jgi:Sec-independent protein translocase protein TatA